MMMMMMMIMIIIIIIIIIAVIVGAVVDFFHTILQGNLSMTQTQRYRSSTVENRSEMELSDR